MVLCDITNKVTTSAHDVRTNSEDSLKVRAPAAFTSTCASHRADRGTAVAACWPPSRRRPSSPSPPTRRTRPPSPLGTGRTCPCSPPRSRRTRPPSPAAHPTNAPAVAVAHPPHALAVAGGPPAAGARPRRTTARAAPADARARVTSQCPRSSSPSPSVSASPLHSRPPAASHAPTLASPSTCRQYLPLTFTRVRV